ncbi:uncharacterized protein LOC107481515 [Arachis duranensis]|uniref:Uncharacterized protein LOC107481515 n=1 Tax=Arachis duranensis TaxID=130453 RepID=A0A6P4CVD2_ARADU|nr:uncharacterized protein LOC107481515 [Arachis duranensis]
MEKGKEIAHSSGVEKGKEVDVDEEYFKERDDDMTNEHQLAFDSIKAYLSKAPIMVNARPYEPLKLYIAASINTIGCMLTQDDENGHERAVYYLSRVLNDIETSFPMLRGCLGKWILALTEFDLQYVPAEAVKGQVIADFLVDNSNNLNDQGTNALLVGWELYLQRGYLSFTEKEFLTDSFSRINGSKHKDGAGVGILIILPEEIPSEFLFELKYPCSNNVTEIHNEIANELAKIALRYRIGPETLKKLASVHQIFVPANEKEALRIDEWEDTDWRKPIAEYLKNPSIPVKRKIKLQAMSFVIMADELNKKGIDGSLLRCLGKDDQNIALGEVHKGICGAHQAGKKIKWVLYRNHVYCLYMIKDCIDYAKHKFILVAIDYFTKWVEAVPLIEFGQNEIIDFIEEHIIHRFGIPQTLSTDQGTMFTGQRIKNFATSRNINMVTSTPYYAQANGQVEAANKILIMLPLEINLNILRVSKQNNLPVDDYWNAMFDELNELDSERILALESMIRQKESVAHSYNR